ncbi:hypothetical protein [Actinoplanes sp. L3-i22]|uniref:hypothetical protein n=1 Tax=Actinoplanes sp. L3-i22 TaxID=2836373 RepID=UPI001C76418F|nr:hypothetical protein [Actinoplanes sp. L3-i22]BCY12188.1 hypothetical protein L3i22_072760 [Actinoplanes sp. L3-i22]
MIRYVRTIARLVREGSLPEVPEFGDERAIRDAPLRDARRDVRLGDWESAREVIAAAGRDWELRGRRIGSLGDLAATDGGWLDEWLRADPDDAAAVLLQSARLGHEAGNARGAASAPNTSAEQAAAFHRLSAQSAEAGRRAIALADPADPVPWVQLLGTQYAAGGSIDEVFEEGRRRDPYHFDLHLTALSLRCEKWFGSHEEMFATAREVAAAAPAGANAVMLPLFAHYEYAMREFAWETRSKQTTKACRKYFRRPEVRDEVDGLVAKWLAGTPNPAGARTCWQWIALFHTLNGRRAAARAVFDELGPYVTPNHAWGYMFGGSEYGYLESWTWAL